MTILAGREKENLPAEESRLRPPGLLLLGLAFLAAALLYSSPVGGGFFGDDFIHLDQAQTIRFFEHPLLTLKKGAYYYFRPWPALWWAILYPLFGFHAAWYRLSNLALHLMVIAAVYAFSRRVIKSKEGAALAALFFAVFPLHGEAVCWISANTDLWATLFLVLSLERYLAWREAEQERVGLAVTAGLVALGALLSKEYIAMLPAAVLLTEILPGARRKKKARLILVGVFTALTAAVWAVKFILAMGQVLPPGLQPATTWPTHFFRTVKILLSPTSEPLFARWATPLLLAAAIWTAALALGSRVPLRPALFGVSWAVLFLLLPAAMGGVAPDLSFSRTLYLPSVGLCLTLASLLLCRPQEARFSRLLKALPAGMLAGFFFLFAAVNLRLYVIAGHASRELEKSLLAQSASFQVGDAIQVSGVPMRLNGVWFMPNSYYLSVAFSLWRFPEEFKSRGYEDREELPLYAVSTEVPAIEKVMAPIRRVRELKEMPLSEFQYRMVWEWTSGEERKEKN